jgi:hypothetical protein
MTEYGKISAAFSGHVRRIKHLTMNKSKKYDKPVHKKDTW